MNNLSTVLENLRGFLKENQNDIILVVGVVLISLVSFGAGRLTATVALAPEPIIVEKANQPTDAVTEENTRTSNQKKGALVARINGTKYYLPDCSGAKRINEENKIWFSSQEEAKDMGYEPASNCPGLSN